MEEDEYKLLKEIMEWCLCIILAILIALLTRYYIGTPTVVRQTSMYPTLEENQRLWISRVRRITNGKYERGDLITFEAPSEIKKTKINYSYPVAEYKDEPQGLINKFTYYILELNKTSYIKRIIAVEGDWVQISEGKVYVNGEAIQEDYLPEGTITEAVCFNGLTVPENCVFVLGDNRANSIDSRTFGCIPFEKIEGKVILRYWPLSELKGL